MRVVSALCALGAAVGVAPALAAQESPVVRAAVQLAADGRGDSARALLNQELGRGRTGEAGWVEALYWRGRLAGDGVDAERDLRRVALEFSTSAWADDALLQLSQLALAAANPAAAYDLAARLRSDYPGSDLRPRAALWGARAAFDVGEPRRACALLDSARAEAAGDVEFQNRVAFYRARCTARVTAPPVRPAPDSGPAPVVRTDTAPRGRADTVRAAPATTSTWDVQVAAVQTESAARDIVRRLGDLGRRARTLRSEGLYRVRVGPYPTREAAEAAIGTIRQRVGGDPFVVRTP